MNLYILYWLKVNAILAFLYLVYFAVLKKEKFFKLNRFYLLGTVIISLLLPLLPLQNVAVVQLREQLPIVDAFSKFYPQLPAGESVNSLEKPATEVMIGSPSLSFSFLEIVFLANVLVAIILILRFAVQLVNIYLLIRKYPNRTGEDGIRYHEHEDTMSPFSFFHHLFINHSSNSADQIQQIIAHEKIHIRQWHTLDILIAEIVQAMLWINPVARLFKQHVKLNLEYLADECVLEQGVNKKNYQLNILQSSLNPDMFPLTNMFNSSKLKLRIKMMNARKTPVKNLYKYALVLPVIALIYIAINVQAVPAPDYRFDEMELKAFEGRYQFQKDKNFFIEITAKGKTLALHELWHDKEIIFERKSELEFSGNHGDFPLSFTKDKNGNIIQLTAFKSDVWDKVAAAEKKVVQLTDAQLKRLEGYYQFQNNKAAYLQFIVRDHQLIARQMWDNVEHTLVAFSETSFESERGLPAKFTLNDQENATQVLILQRDVLDKVAEYKPVARKIATLNEAELKAVEGYYQFEKKREYYVQVYAKGNGIMLKELWNDGERFFEPESATTFSSIPIGSVSFTKDANGKITQMLSVGKEVMVKVEDYKPAAK